MGEWIEKVRDWIDRGKELLENVVVRYVLIAVLVVIVMVLLMGKSYGSDVLVLEAQGDRVVLEMTPCTSETKAVFRHDIQTMNATYVIGKLKKTVAGCYATMDTPQGKVVFLLFEDGDRYAIPLDKFKPGDISAKRVGFLI